MTRRRKNVPWQNIADIFPDTAENPFVSDSLSEGVHQEIIKYLQGENNKTPEKKPWFLWLVSSKFQSTIARSFLNEELIENANKAKEVQKK